MHPSPAPARQAPSWLLDEPYDEVSLGTLKSGKEAEVFLLERRYASGSTVLLAHKRYRPRRPAQFELRELGFGKATRYRHDSTYRAGWFLSSRDRRAVAHKTDHGHDVIERMWPIQEMTMLKLAWASGASVPYPVERTDDGVVMEFIGDLEAAAPRLAQAQLSADEIASAWEQLLVSLRALTSAGVVHADLSAYNLLWWRGSRRDHRPAAGGGVHLQRGCPGAPAPGPHERRRLVRAQWNGGGCRERLRRADRPGLVATVGMARAIGRA